MRQVIKAGRLRHWMLFESLVAQNDSDGALVEDWVPAFAVNSRMPVELTPLSGRERIAAGAQYSQVTHRMKVRFRPEFEADGFNMRCTEHRSKAAPVVYAIEAVIPDPDSGFQYVTLLASTGISAAGN